MGRTGSNEVVILEMDKGQPGCSVRFDDKPDFSGTPPTPCDGVLQAGDVLHMRQCDSSLGDYMAWELRNASSGRKVLALGGLCLGRGPAHDPQSGQPSATLIGCASAAEFEVKRNQV